MANYSGPRIPPQPVSVSKFIFDESEVPEASLIIPHGSTQLHSPKINNAVKKLPEYDSYAAFHISNTKPDNRNECRNSTQRPEVNRSGDRNDQTEDVNARYRFREYGDRPEMYIGRFGQHNGLPHCNVQQLRNDPMTSHYYSHPNVQDPCSAIQNQIFSLVNELKILFKDLKSQTQSQNEQISNLSMQMQGMAKVLEEEEKTKQQYLADIKKQLKSVLPNENQLCTQNTHVQGIEQKVEEVSESIQQFMTDTSKNFSEIMKIMTEKKEDKKLLVCSVGTMTNLIQKEPVIQQITNPPIENEQLPCSSNSYIHMDDGPGNGQNYGPTIYKNWAEAAFRKRQELNWREDNKEDAGRYECEGRPCQHNVQSHSNREDAGRYECQHNVQSHNPRCAGSQHHPCACQGPMNYRVQYSHADSIHINALTDKYLAPTDPERDYTIFRSNYTQVNYRGNKDNYTPNAGTPSHRQPSNGFKF